MALWGRAIANLFTFTSLQYNAVLVFAKRDLTCSLLHMHTLYTLFPRHRMLLYLLFFIR